MMSFRHFRYFFTQLLAMFCLGQAAFALAQDAGQAEQRSIVVESNSNLEESSLAADSTENVTISLSAQTLRTPALQGTVESAPEPVGECDVVNGIIADYCAGSPEDISCQVFQ